MTQIIDERARDEQAEIVSDAPARPNTRAWLHERVSDRRTAVIGISWYVLFPFALWLEPAAHHDTAVAQLVGTVLTMALLGALMTMAIGLVARQRWGFAASVMAAGFFTAMAVACPTTGHHTIGLWWFGQMACALALVGLSVNALRARPASPTST